MMRVMKIILLRRGARVLHLNIVDLLKIGDMVSISIRVMKS